LRPLKHRVRVYNDAHLTEHKGYTRLRRYPSSKRGISSGGSRSKLYGEVVGVLCQDGVTHVCPQPRPASQHTGCRIALSTTSGKGWGRPRRINISARRHGSTYAWVTARRVEWHKEYAMRVSSSPEAFADASQKGTNDQPRRHQTEGTEQARHICHLLVPPNLLGILGIRSGIMKRLCQARFLEDREWQMGSMGKGEIVILEVNRPTIPMRRVPCQQSLLQNPAMMCGLRCSQGNRATSQQLRWRNPAVGILENAVTCLNWR